MSRDSLLKTGHKQKQINPCSPLNIYMYSMLTRCYIKYEPTIKMKFLKQITRERAIS